VDETLKRWMSQITTGHGAMILGPTLLAVASGTLSWQAASPFLLAGIAGLLWPERATPDHSNVDAIIAAYRAGIEHGTVLAVTLRDAEVREGAAARVAPGEGRVGSRLS